VSKMTITCQAWRPLTKGSLRGFAVIHVAELALTIRDVALHESRNKCWAALPSKPWIENDRLVRDDAGKAKYSPLFEFDRPEVRSAFSDAVVRAVLDGYPEALGRREEAS
jgi:hypothetical protein